MTSRRLDLALVDAGLARSRTHARRIIEEGRARIDGRAASKPSAPVHPDAALGVVDVPDGIEYASRAAHKLAGALDVLGIDVRGHRCLDAGASTGGFTDVLLRRGAAEVVAVDIGHGQLSPHLREDPRVHVLDGTSIRGLSSATVGGTVRTLVADLSFISLTTVIRDLAGLVEPGGDLVLMVKPQFEVGRARLPRTGVVRDPEDRRRAVRAVADAAGAASLTLHGVGRSALPGQDGNVEYFLHLGRSTRPGAPGPRGYDMIDQAVDGPDGRTEPARRDREGHTP
ncbi:TlyA family RNA methyltransferase [Brachybacterium sp. AOP25-B2-12]|uniref:TlyA family RNA methyltransferase n=1 Tax=Brachybacterium sp. AOP25-B2-12 TaxID=3457710 RepID=UPI004034E638